jgi:nicotinamidase-related amidase
MPNNDALRYGAPGETAAHLCVDMQKMFAEGTEWKMPWLERIQPNIVAITSARPEKTIFTRFIPARRRRAKARECGSTIMRGGNQ